MNTQSTPTPHNPLTASLKTQRHHGASMMKGARWQTLVALDRALDVLAGSPLDALVLEGVEDVEVFVGNQWSYIQAKDLADYRWEHLAGVLGGFAQALARDPGLTFELSMVEGNTTKDVEDLIALCSGATLPPARAQKLIERAKPSCAPHGIAARDLLGGRLTVVRRTREQAWDDIVEKVMGVLGCPEQSARMHAHFLGYSLLERAPDRVMLSQADLARMVDESRESASMERSGFAALASGHVERLDFTRYDSTPEDFLQGKSARLGHVVAGLDVRRDVWMDEIDGALGGDFPVCLIMSSSGQGKSTLMYRYALESFAHEQVFALKSCESTRDARAVCSMLATKVKLGLDVRLLIDGADWRTSSWVEVAKECSRLGIPTLVAVRHEDFIRYGSRIEFGFSRVAPTLTANEAQQLHANLEEDGRLHKQAPGWQQAFERIDTPRLFIEYIYLLTQGRLLRDRLEEQVRSLDDLRGRHHEALALISMAHTLGVPVQKARLLDALDHGTNARALFEPLEHEYLAPLTSEDDGVTGLHWVRSQHLAELTHGRFAREVDTFSRVLRLTLEEHALGAIEAALGRPSIERPACICVIVDWIAGDIDRLLEVLRVGLRACARAYACKHEDALNEVFELGGAGFLTLFSTQFGVTPTPFIDQMSQLNPDAGHLPELRQIRDRLVTPDHFAIARSIIEALDSDRIVQWAYQAEPGRVGELMDWMVMCGCGWPEGGGVDSCLERVDPSDMETSFETILRLLQGAGRLDPEAYSRWLDSRSSALTERIRIETDSTVVEHEEPETVRVEFLITPDVDQSDINGEAVTRLRALRKAYPLADTYCSRATSVLPNPLGVTHVRGGDFLEGQAYKDIPKANLPFESDIFKNTEVAKTFFELSSPDTLFVRATHWEQARCTFDGFLSRLVRWVNSARVHALNPPRNAPCPCGSGEKYKKCCRKVYQGEEPDCTVVDRVLRTLPPPTDQWGDDLKEHEDRARAWAGSAHDFLKYLASNRRVAVDDGPQAYRLLTQALERLDGLHACLDAVANRTHGFAPCLPEDPTRLYRDALDLFEAQTVEAHPVVTPWYLRGALEQLGCVVGERSYAEGQLRGVAVACPIGSLERLDDVLDNVRRVLDTVLNWGSEVHKVLLFPVIDGNRASEAGFAFTVSTLQQNDVGWVPEAIPERALSTLPEYPYLQTYEAYRLAVVWEVNYINELMEAWARELSVLGQSSGLADRTLVERHRDRLNCWVQNALSMLASELRTGPFAHEFADDIERLERVALETVAVVETQTTSSV